MGIPTRRRVCVGQLHQIRGGEGGEGRGGEGGGRGGEGREERGGEGREGRGEEGRPGRRGAGDGTRQTKVVSHHLSDFSSLYCYFMH